MLVTLKSAQLYETRSNISAYTRSCCVFNLGYSRSSRLQWCFPVGGTTLLASGTLRRWDLAFRRSLCQASACYEELMQDAHHYELHHAFPVGKTNFSFCKSLLSGTVVPVKGEPLLQTLLFCAHSKDGSS